MYVQTTVFLLLCFFGFGGIALGKVADQDPIPISGTVKNRQGQAVVSANVFIKGTLTGAHTDEHGFFQFNTTIRGDTLLLIRHIGMHDQEFHIHIQDQGITGLPPEIRMDEKSSRVDDVLISASLDRISLDGNRAILLRTMDIETTAGSDGDIVGALKSLPGVQQIGEDAALFVRGGSKEEARTMIDGLEISHPYYTGVPGLAQKSRFSPHLFKGISFNTGGYSSVYGDALSSVLALESRDHPTKSSTIIAMMPYGLQAGHDYVNNKSTTSFGVDLGYSDFTTYYKWIGHRTEWIDAPTNKLFSANFRQNIGEKGFLKWYGYGNSSAQEALIPDVERQGEKFPFRIENQNAVSLLTYTHKLPRDWQFYIGHGFNYNHENQNFGKLRDLQHQIRMQVQGDLSPMWTINAGTEGFWYDWNTYNQQGEQPDHNQRMDGWVDANYTPFQQLTLQMGLRSAWSHYLRDKTLLMPRASATYQQGHHSFTFSAGQYAQQPQLSQLYQFEQEQLKHARVNHYLLNYQHKVFGRLLKAEVYHKDYSRLIRTVDQPGSTGNGYARGFDFFWKDNASIEGLDYWISYTYLDTERQYLDYPVQTRPTFAAPHTLHIVGKQFIESLGLFVGASYSMSSGRPYYNPNHPVFLGEQTPTYHQINLNFALLRKWGNTFNTFVFAVNNLAGRRQVFDYQFSQNGSYHQAVELPYKRGILIGWFISIGQDRSEEIIAQLPN